MTYISEFMQGFENAIFASDGRDPKTGKHYSEFVDFDSLVLKYMLEEISMNVDGNGSSQYYVKPSDSVSTVAYAGPCWDYDQTFAGFAANTYRERFLDAKSLPVAKVNRENHYWWPELYVKEDFLAGVKQAWSGKYSHAMRILLGEETDGSGLLLSVTQYAEEIRESAAMNYLRWPPKGANAKRTGMTFDANITFLTNILQTRYTYLEKTWGTDK